MAGDASHHEAADRPGVRGGMRADVLARIEAVASLVAMVDAETASGQAVLASVQRDLNAAYDVLAAHVRRRGRETE